jgi:hypothetical protein
VRVLFANTLAIVVVVVSAAPFNFIALGKRVWRVVSVLHAC